MRSCRQRVNLDVGGPPLIFFPLPAASGEKSPTSRHAVPMKPIITTDPAEVVQSET